MGTNQISTSFYKDKMELYIRGNDLIFRSLPLWAFKSRIMICLDDIHGNEVFKEVYVPQIDLTVSFERIKEGHYLLFVLYPSTCRINYYISISNSNGIPIYVGNKEIYAEIPIPLEDNKIFFMNLKNDWLTKLYYRSSSNTYPADLIEIKTLAERITKYATGNYNKILAVHDWVADNLYYDYDALSSRKYMYEKYDALSMLKERRTVCRGYSKLAVTLLRSINIPAVDVNCFALGGSSNGGWLDSDNLTAEANHIITFALADNRWIIMDPTWDSVNEYRKGRYIKKTGGGARHNYFDATLVFFSYTHRFIK